MRAERGAAKRTSGTEDNLRTVRDSWLHVNAIAKPNTTSAAIKGIGDSSARRPYYVSSYRNRGGRGWRWWKGRQGQRAQGRGFPK